MKNKPFSKIYLTLLFLIIFSIKTNGQWLVGNFLGNFWGETDPANRIDAIGIGDYTGNTNQPAAALDITIPYLFNQGAMLANQGEAIRSSVAPNFDHTWKMFTFNNPLVEKFRILNIGNLNLTTYQAFDGAASVNDIHLNLIPKGNMNFFTENKLWMRL